MIRCREHGTVNQVERGSKDKLARAQLWRRSIRLRQGAPILTTRRWQSAVSSLEKLAFPDQLCQHVSRG